MIKKIAAYIELHQMIDTRDVVIAGVSGGADSLCLLFVLVELRQELDFRLEVVHVEHGIRGAESRGDAAFVEAVCEQQAIPFHLYPADVPRLAGQWRISVEEAARRVRYQAFAEVCRDRGGTRIAVAHNREDQAETILYNLIRGSGLRGLGGIRPVNGRIIRPLLATPRAEIEDWLTARDVDWRTDRTNDQTDYTRNKLRHQVFPLLERDINRQAVSHITAAGEELRQVEELLEQGTARKAALILCPEPERPALNGRLLGQEVPLQQQYLVRYWLEQCGVGLQDISRLHIEAVCRLARAQSGRTIDLPGPWVCLRRGDFLRLKTGSKLPARLPPESCELVIPGETRWGKWCFKTVIEPYKCGIIPENRYTKWLDYDTIQNTVHLRTRLPGDYFVMAEGRKKLKKYFVDEKITQEERDHIPILAEGKHVLWAVGYRISDRCKVTEKTRQILKIQVVEE